jgi:hypothetical protein
MSGAHSAQTVSGPTRAGTYAVVVGAGTVVVVDVVVEVDVVVTVGGVGWMHHWGLCGSRSLVQAILAYPGEK